MRTQTFPQLILTVVQTRSLVSGKRQLHLTKSMVYCNNVSSQTIYVLLTSWNDNCNIEAGTASKSFSMCVQFRKTVELWDWNSYWINAYSFFFLFVTVFHIEWINALNFRLCSVQKVRLIRYRLRPLWPDRKMCYDVKKKEKRHYHC